MTKAEAEGKGCPFARVYQSVYLTAAASNRLRSGTYDTGAMCQTSKCMAWVWLDSGKKDGDCRAFSQKHGN